MGSANEALKKHYVDRYKRGVVFGSHYSGNECSAIEKMIPGENWVRKRVLEIGCGAGMLASRLWGYGAIVDAVDYCQEGIDLARKFFNLQGLNFICKDYREIEVKQKYDIVVSQGTFEHFDNPYKEMDFVLDNLLMPDGIFIFSTPNFANIRGCMWLLLEAIKGYMVDKLDLHHLWIPDIQDFFKKRNMNLSMTTSDISWGNGDLLLQNIMKHYLFQEVLPNGAMKKLIIDLLHVLPYVATGDMSGFSLICKAERK